VITGWPWADDPPPTGSIVGPVFDQEPGDHYGRRYRIVDEIARSWLRRPGRRPDGVGFVSGAALLIDSTAFETIGGFDERYFLFYEDIEFCLRANRLGIPVIVEPGWTVTHERGHSTRSRFGDSLRWSYESACTFHADQHESLTLYRLYVAVDSAARAVVHRLRGRRPTSDAYRALARRAISDCARAFRSRP
jgi:GT2 family glycosyltransferase